mgnify:CR=1 FL=1
MMQAATKQQKWWKRSLNTFLATALVASSISFIGFPQEVKAATNDTPLSSPAGVDGAVLWLRPDKGISIESGQTVSEWQDQSNTGNHATQNTTTLQPMYRNDAQYNVNFNPMLEFNNKYFNLDVNKLPTGNSSRTIVAVAASENNTGDNRYIISWGTASLGSMIGMLQLSGTTKGAMSIFGGSFSSEEGFWQKNVPNELVATYDGTNGALYSKTTQIGKAKQSWNTANTQARVGRIIGGGRAEEWIGTIGDIIVYDRALDEAERKQISSYLAIKYGYTLDVEGLPTNSKKADYLASDTSVLWDATANADYYHSIAGIARDDNGGLLQKQSNSTNPGNQVVIGLNEINDKNSSNPAQFSTDMQYLMWGDNNLPFAYTQPTNDGRAHTERIWKVQNRGNVGQVEFAIPKDALPEKGALLVGNEDFSSNTEYPLTWKTINGKEYYTTKLTFTDGQYFTLVTTKPELEKATLTQTVTDNNEVTLIFDQSVTLTDLNGFTITKDGIEIPIGNVTYKIDGNTIVLTLPTNENVTGESVINVEYKKATGNLIGKTNSLPVGDFKIQAINSFAASLTIETPTSTIVTTPQPEIKGKVEVGSDVEVVIKDKQGNVIPNVGSKASVDANGNWTFTPGIDLVDGDYTIEVKATKDGKTAKETKDITVNTSLPTIQITEPAGTVSTTKPDIKGTVDPDATVKVVIKDKNGNVVPNAGGEATVDVNGNWTFTPGIDLVDGDYTIEVEAIKDGKTAKETKGITVNTVTPSAPIVVITEPIEGKVETSKPEFKGMGTPGSTVTVEIKDKAGNVIDTPLVTVNPDGTWSFVPTNNLLDGDYTVEVTAKKDGETTSINKTITINTKTLPIFTPSLTSLIPSQGVLNPSFSSEVTNYSMNVDYLTSQLSFLAIPSNLGVSVTTTINGQLGTLGQIPLQVGENIIIITVTDTNGNVRHYTIKVYREAYTGGGTWTPDPTPNPTTPTTTEPSTATTKIQVALEIDGDNPLEKTTVEIERTKHANGETTDFVALTETNAKEAVEKAKQIGNNVARIVIPDVNDEVDKVTVEIPKQSLQLLRDNGLSLEIATENGLIAIPLSSMNGVDDNFYFRLVPVKKESERKAIEERARAEKVVRETLQSNDVNVMARSKTIETNRLVQVTLPLRGVKVPTVAAERQVFLDQLAVFIEHSDGEKKVVFPEVVTMVKGELGLRFTVDKFSTFTVIQFTKPTVGKHEVYIKGFPNGTFGPEENVTRAQVATMIARLLGYTDDQTIDYAPFKDIPSNHYAAGAIAFVKDRGIMNGDMNGNFRASENITRAQMATVVANYKHLQIEEGVEITFNDIKGHWAQWIIEANRTAGIINGRQDGSFAPNEHLTRAQAVVMMNRMFERGPLNGVTTPSFQDVKATHWAFKEIEEAAKSHSYVIDEDDKEQLSK